MGEKVWYKKIGVGVERKNKAETQWFPGIWLGPTAISSETLIGTSAGVVRASAIKRFGETEKWDIQAILDMKGTPQQPNPNKPGLHIPIQIRLEAEVPFEMPDLRQARDEDAPKRSYLKRYHFNEHGYTVDCEGCARLSAGMASRPHAEACRKRMYEAMRNTELVEEN